MMIYQENIWDTKDLPAYEATHEWLVDKIEETPEGIRVYVEGAEFPQKGIPSAEAMWSLNILKKICAEGMRYVFSPLVALSLFWRWKEVVASFNLISRKILGPYYLKPQVMSPFARELQLFLTVLMTELGIINDFTLKNGAQAHWFAENVAHVLEFDMAYRWRIQDLISESSLTRISHPEEWKRLRALLRARDLPSVAMKTDRFLKAIQWILRIPRVQRAFACALGTIDFEKLKLDEADRYWCCFRTDYKFFGLSDTERLKMLEERGWKIPVSHEIIKE